MSLFNKHIVNETIIVEGMKCQHCVSKVKDALKKNHIKYWKTLDKSRKICFNYMRLQPVNKKYIFFKFQRNEWDAAYDENRR